LIFEPRMGPRERPEECTTTVGRDQCQILLLYRQDTNTFSSL
jgi:hypothetical protein